MHSNKREKKKSALRIEKKETEKRRKFRIKNKKIRTERNPIFAKYNFRIIIINTQRRDWGKKRERKIISFGPTRRDASRERRRTLISKGKKFLFLWRTEKEDESRGKKVLTSSLHISLGSNKAKSFFFLLRRRLRVTPRLSETDPPDRVRPAHFPAILMWRFNSRDLVNGLSVYIKQSRNEKRAMWEEDGKFLQNICLHFQSGRRRSKGRKTVSCILQKKKQVSLIKPTWEMKKNNWSDESFLIKSHISEREREKSKAVVQNKQLR